MMMMKTEDSSSDDGVKSNKIKNMIKSSSDQKATSDGLRDNDYMSQTICLFRKYLLAKTHHQHQLQNVGNNNKSTNMEEESQEVVYKRHIISPCGPLILPPSTSRPISLLERGLLPTMRGDGADLTSVGHAKSSEQLTIFYAGTVNVYDNVSYDKAEAIMLLAGESSLTKPIVESTKSQVTKAVPLHGPNLKSFCNLQSDLPIARKRSIRHFLEKRRQRLEDKSPYNFHVNTKKEKNEAATTTNNNENFGLSLSPFPSLLGFQFPVSSSTN